MLSLSSLFVCFCAIAQGDGAGALFNTIEKTVRVDYSFAQATQQKVAPIPDTPGCGDRHFRDSLVDYYLTTKAAQLPGSYNNPRWGAYCDSVLLICPNTAAAYQLKALPFLKSGDYAIAFRLNDKAVALEPAGYLDYRGFLKCIFTKDYEAAITDLLGAEKLSPNGGLMDHSYSFFIGVCKMELGQYDEAMSYLAKDISLQTGGDPLKTPHFNSSFYMGLLYYRMEKFDDAKKFLQDCLTAYDQHPEANYYMAMIVSKEGNIALATRYLNVARKALRNGYRMNEDNIYYANYPGQITLNEINSALQK